MNTNRLYRLVKVFEDMGLSHDAAFELAFTTYKSAREQKAVQHA